MTDPLIELKNISKFYKDNKISAVRDISINIQKGQRVALIGPSGCGKSTLLSIVGLTVSPSEGIVKILGQNLVNSSESSRAEFRKKHISFVFQHFELLPTLNSLENVMVPLLLNKINVSNSKALATEMLEKVGLKDRLSHFPDKLSGGEMQRVSIARAFVTKPDILLADEPTGSLDSENGEAILRLFEIASNEGSTIIMATHSEEAIKISDRIIRLKDGIILDDKSLVP